MWQPLPVVGLQRNISVYRLYRSPEIAVISRSTWSKTSTFSSKDISGAISALALSSNGQYLVSAVQSSVYVWSIETKRVISRSVNSIIYYLSYVFVIVITPKALRLHKLHSLRGTTFLPGVISMEGSRDGQNQFQIIFRVLSDLLREHLRLVRRSLKPPWMTSTIRWITIPPWIKIGRASCRERV